MQLIYLPSIAYPEELFEHTTPLISLKFKVIFDNLSCWSYNAYVSPVTLKVSKILVLINASKNLSALSPSLSPKNLKIYLSLS